jgi:hypothetical protein
VVGRWATKELVSAWIDRARRRTIKYLREEVGAVMAAVTMDPRVSRSPPKEDDMAAVAELEREVQSGELLGSFHLAALRGPQTSVTLAAATAEPGVRRTLRLTLSADLYAHWQAVEADFVRLGGVRDSFVSFLCMCLWETWQPYLEQWDDKWKEIYQRDRCRCTSPVCERHDVTPHHITFKAHGGSDAPSNVTAPCDWCHLDGVHGGRLEVEGEASHLTWRIGRDPILAVVGRKKIVLAP